LSVSLHDEYGSSGHQRSYELRANFPATKRSAYLCALFCISWRPLPTTNRYGGDSSRDLKYANPDEIGNSRPLGQFWCTMQGRGGPAIQPQCDIRTANIGTGRGRGRLRRRTLAPLERPAGPTEREQAARLADSLVHCLADQLPGHPHSPSTLPDKFTAKFGASRSTRAPRPTCASGPAHSSRQLLSKQYQMLAIGNGRPAAWKARYDPRYEDSYVLNDGPTDPLTH